MKKVLAFNGSPRKTWNTATLLNKALEGAASQGAQTQFIHLNDLTFKGCQSCFKCKTIGGKSYGKCSTRDELTPIMDGLPGIDAIVLGSPIYLGAASGAMRSFLERLIFPYLVYDTAHSTLFPKRLNTAFIYTMNSTEETYNGGRLGVIEQVKGMDMFLTRIFRATESLIVTDTYQFNDYSKVVATGFDEQRKAKRRKEIFPQDCQKAFELGVRLVTR